MAKSSVPLISFRVSPGIPNHEVHEQGHVGGQGSLGHLGDCGEIEVFAHDLVDHPLNPALGADAERRDASAHRREVLVEHVVGAHAVRDLEVELPRLEHLKQTVEVALVYVRELVEQMDTLGAEPFEKIEVPLEVGCRVTPLGLGCARGQPRVRRAVRALEWTAPARKHRQGSSVNRERPARSPEVAHHALVQPEVGVEVDEIPSGQWQIVERLELGAHVTGRLVRASVPGQLRNETAEGPLGLVTQERVDFGVGGERIGGRRVDDVLTRLVEVGQDHRHVGLRRAQGSQELAEQGVAMGRSMKRRQRNDHDVRGGDRAGGVGHGRAEAHVALLERA